VVGPESTGGFSSSLSFPSLTVGQSGNYTCVAENEAGRHATSALLVVNGIKLLRAFPLSPRSRPLRSAGSSVMLRREGRDEEGGGRGFSTYFYPQPCLAQGAGEREPMMASSRAIQIEANDYYCVDTTKEKGQSKRRHKHFPSSSSEKNLKAQPSSSAGPRPRPRRRRCRERRSPFCSFQNPPQRKKPFSRSR